MSKFAVHRYSTNSSVEIVFKFLGSMILEMWIWICAATGCFAPEYGKCKKFRPMGPYENPLRISNESSLTKSPATFDF